MIYVKIVDEKGKEIDIKDLTDTGIEMAISDCKELLSKLEMAFNNQ